MKIIRAARWISTGAACGILATGFLVNHQWTAALFIAVLGIVWFLLQQFHWYAGGFLLLSLLTGFAVYSIWVGVHPIWALVSLVAGLTAWDLEYFMYRQSQVQRMDYAEQLARQHLSRLAALNGIGLLLAGAVLLVRVHFSLGLALFLGLVAVLGISQLVRFLRQESD